MLNWNEIQSKAAALGVNSTSSDRTTLIRKIQAAERNTACYKTKNACDQMQCCWRDECVGRKTARFTAIKPNG